MVQSHLGGKSPPKLQCKFNPQGEKSPSKLQSKFNLPVEKSLGLEVTLEIEHLNHMVQSHSGGKSPPQLHLILITRGESHLGGKSPSELRSKFNPQGEKSPSEC